MPSWTRFSSAPQHVDILLFQSFSALCLANTVEPLRAANQLSGHNLYSWRFVTMDGGSATSSSNMQVAAQARLADCGGDLLIAMPSYSYRQHATATTARGLRSAVDRYRVLAGFDTGSWLLAHAGLLQDRKSTIHWQELQSFAEAFSDVAALRERYVIDDDRITCSGAQAAFDVTMELIGQRHGQALRLEVATLFMSPEATGDPGIPIAHGRAVTAALNVMLANLEHPLTIGAVARRVGRSQTDLEQRMRAAMGTAPQTVYRRLRLIEAKRLVLGTDQSVSEISLRCGYGNPSAMTRAFRAEFGITPQALRRQLA